MAAYGREYTYMYVYSYAFYGKKFSLVSDIARNGWG